MVDTTIRDGAVLCALPACKMCGGMCVTCTACKNTEYDRLSYLEKLVEQMAADLKETERQLDELNGDL